MYNFNGCCFCVFCQAAILFFRWNTFMTYMKAFALKKTSQIQRGSASIFNVTSPYTCVRHLVSPSPVPQPFTC